MKFFFVALAVLSLVGCASVPATALPTSVTPQEQGITATKAVLRSVHTPGTLVSDLSLSARQCHVKVLDAPAGKVLPDPLCTPGAVDPAVTQNNINATICVSGYTSTVRPSSALAAKYKTLSLAQYSEQNLPTVEYDHLVSLQLGGASSVSNLWPQPNAVSAISFVNPKDAIETVLNKAVCAGKVSLAAAQAAIASNWVTARAKLHL